ncbi:DUF3501 family protein [Pendulispora albinea]|uniref:DUF3501 family protein n=1 Tax=Pendulispora albinea TaxID=2741071 RepID=A0ABZ2LJR2_9BACT
MKPIARNEILSLGEYEAVRPHFRARIIEEKKRRRLALGPYASCVFENRDTVLLQIQEMLRTERITREGAVLHEIETYNQLVPAPGELSATVMIEIDERATREKFLADALGIERHIALVVDGERFNATWDPERLLPDRASAVLYLKFPLSEKAVRAIRQGATSLELLVDHPRYQARVPLSEATTKSLAEDLEAHAGA